MVDCANSLVHSELTTIYGAKLSKQKKLKNIKYVYCRLDIKTFFTLEIRKIYMICFFRKVKFREKTKWLFVCKFGQST